MNIIFLSSWQGKAKGVENLIEVENPNRIQKKVKKLSKLNESLETSEKPELSRKERCDGFHLYNNFRFLVYNINNLNFFQNREQLEKQRAQANYQRLHAAGKTDEARADLARLAIIKQQREEAAKKREEEKRQKDMEHQKKTEAKTKGLGKKA